MSLLVLQHVQRYYYNIFEIFLQKSLEVTSRKYALKQGNRIGVHFIKYNIQRCIFKMCRNFTYEVVGQRRRLKTIKKNSLYLKN
jgi:hypothetical protein